MDEFAGKPPDKNAWSDISFVISAKTHVVDGQKNRLAQRDGSLEHQHMF